MSVVSLTWILGGILALLAGMIVVLIVARTLDGSHDQSQRQFADKMSELAGKATKAGREHGAPGWLTGTVASTLTSLADNAKQNDDDPESKIAASEGQKQMKSLLTGLAIAGGVIMLIVGIITGDGS